MSTNTTKKVVTLGLSCVAFGAVLLVASHFLAAAPIQLNINNGVVLIPGFSPWYQFLAKELGFALVVAGVIASTVDFFMKQEQEASADLLLLAINTRHEKSADDLVKKMNERLFHTVLGRDIPNRLYAQIQEQLLNSDFYRDEFRVFFVFGTAEKDDKNPDPLKYIRLTEHTIFRVKNISETNKTYTVSLSLDAHQFDSNDNVPQGRLDFVKINNKQVECESAPNKFTTNEINASKPIVLKPDEEAVIDSLSVCYMRLIDEQAFTVNHPTDGALITAISHLPSLKIQAYANHPNPLTIVSNDKSLLEWRQDCAILPRQGFTVKWTNS